MTIHQRLVEAEATVESQGTELHAKRQEVDSLRQSNLKWSKKVGAFVLSIRLLCSALPVSRTEAEDLARQETEERRRRRFPHHCITTL